MSSRWADPPGFNGFKTFLFVAGVAARRRGKASRQGVAARRRGKASRQGVAARRRGKASRQSKLERFSSSFCQASLLFVAKAGNSAWVGSYFVILIPLLYAILKISKYS